MNRLALKQATSLLRAYARQNDNAAGNTSRVNISKVSDYCATRGIDIPKATLLQAQLSLEGDPIKKWTLFEAGTKALGLGTNDAKRLIDDLPKPDPQALSATSSHAQLKPSWQSSYGLPPEDTHELAESQALLQPPPQPVNPEEIEALFGEESTPEMLHDLARRGLDLNAALEESYEQPPIIFFIQRGRADMVRALIAENVELSRPGGVSPLMEALYKGRADLVGLLVKHVPPTEPEVLLAALSSSPACLIALAEAGAKLDVKFPPRGESLLHKAAGIPEMCAALLSPPVSLDPNIKDDSGATPLCAASLKPESVEHFLSAGAEVNTQPSPLGEQAMCGNLETMLALYRAGADPNGVNLWGLPALQLAIGAKQEEAARVLVAMGASPLRTYEEDGSNALYLACQEGLSEDLISEMETASGVERADAVRDAKALLRLHVILAALSPGDCIDVPAAPPFDSSQIRIEGVTPELRTAFDSALTDAVMDVAREAESDGAELLHRALELMAPQDPKLIRERVEAREPVAFRAMMPNHAVTALFAGAIDPGVLYLCDTSGAWNPAIKRFSITPPNRFLTSLLSEDCSHLFAHPEKYGLSLCDEQIPTDENKGLQSRGNCGPASSKGLFLQALHLAAKERGVPGAHAKALYKQSTHRLRQQLREEFQETSWPTRIPMRRLTALVAPSSAGAQGLRATENLIKAGNYRSHGNYDDCRRTIKKVVDYAEGALAQGLEEGAASERIYEEFSDRMARAAAIMVKSAEELSREGEMERSLEFYREALRISNAGISQLGDNLTESPHLASLTETHKKATSALSAPSQAVPKPTPE